MAINPFHTMDTDDHGTPAEVCDLSRTTLGEIDLDPSSSYYWNHWTVKARHIYTEADDFTTKPLFGRIHWNPPGGKAQYEGSTRETSLPRIAWRRLIEHWRQGLVHSAVWIGYSLQQLTLLQGELQNPLQFTTLFPCERFCFLQRAPGNGPPIKSKSPMHGNYVTLLHTLHNRDEAKDQMGRFVERARRLDVGGQIVRPL